MLVLQFNWIKQYIDTPDKAEAALHLITELSPRVAAFDTETTGLHIIKDRPFLYQCGFVDEKTKTGYAFAVDLQRQPLLAKDFIIAWHSKVKLVQQYCGHNIKFDLHMLLNINIPYTHENVTDTMFYIRLAHDAVATKDGGPPLKLKDYTTRYITRDAKTHEHVLNNERSLKASEFNNKLLLRLNKLAPQKPWTKGRLQDFFKDAVVDYTNLTSEEQQAYKDWRTLDLPAYLHDIVQKLVVPDDIPYNTLNRDAVIHYALYDIVYTLEVFYSLEPILEARKNTIGLQYENLLIFPLLEMERQGFAIDIDYLNIAQQKLKDYIIVLRNNLKELTGVSFTVGQHAVIKSILNNTLQNTNYTLNSVNKDSLLRLHEDLQIDDKDNKVIKIVENINELRTLEKWYSTYILRFKKNLSYTNRLYTQINQVGTVSGRVTSDFQQFPKGGIESNTGEKLFTPRQMVKVSGGDYNGIVYLDYSQIELRFQAMYTILVGNPDINLCRAYMPYQCCRKTGEQFDFNNTTHRQESYDNSWYYIEAPETQWTPTDVHGATTEQAFGITPDDEMFHELRYIGKRVNFAKNYGAQYKKLRTMFPEYDEEQVRKIDEAYYKAFPGVKKYHDYCYALANAQPYATNLFGIRYYGVSGHDLKNRLVQGSAAYFLKWKIRQIYEYSKANNIQSKFQMNIHDELSWEKHITESDVFTEFQNIMQNWEDGLVPIIADMEMTTTTWDEKFTVDTIPAEV